MTVGLSAPAAEIPGTTAGWPRVAVCGVSGTTWVWPLPWLTGAVNNEIVHRVAFGVLVDSDRALLAHRHPGRRIYPNVWDLPGGHIEDGESPEETLRRELFEELGSTSWGGRLTTPVVVQGAETHVFVVTAWEGEPTNLAPDEHDDMGWFTADEVAGLAVGVPEVVALVVEALQAR